MNPLLDFTGLPRFDTITPEHVAPAMHQLLDENRALIARLIAPDTPATWDDFVQPMLDAGERLSRAWGIVGHLHSVNDIPPWREAYNALLPEVSSFYADLGQNLALYSKYKALASSDAFGTLTAARKKIIDNELRDFRLSGAELPEDKKPRFKAIQEALSALAAKFSENVLDATNAHAEWITDAAELAGLPDDVIAAARAAAEKESKPGWKFTLHAPSYMPVLQYANHRDLRARMYRASATRAAEFGPTEWDNGPLIDQILALRDEEAKLLGYANFAEVSLATKMAENPAQVIAFLRDLAHKARPFAERDLAELRAFAQTECGLATLESWDMAWVSEKLRQSRYSFSDDEVKQYFPEQKVLSGLFRVVESLYNVQLLPDTAPVWNPTVRFFRIERLNPLSGAGQLIGQFYVDLYARETKRGGAWMDEAITRRRITSADFSSTIQTPVAYLNCNFPAPIGEGEKQRPATFSHDDVITLFHECGHGLHHLLTQVDELPISGIRGVEWDAVELPSQFMENFCWEWDVLSGMTAHVDTGAALPRALYDKMLAAKNFQSGLQMLRQIEFSLFDFQLHSDYQPGGAQTVRQLLDAVRREVAVIVPPEWNRFPNSFSHIFGGGYAAGYYSYKWAEVLSADAYSAFEEASQKTGSTLDAATGERFWREILAVGGARPALESFAAFRGRAPQPDALLRHSGMVVAA
ncbi:oligopeptidase A [Rugosibacter aromaticivorans]|uniref:oligopeptidase A n=1 Tax=Rugosibacter aromaticivorans TaxID=1565605 RepID=A0A0C5JBT0_9PROT|nr:M3 family metallopeptidase [Rugosibacter aromaticivorans]AJP49199.1 oligopeptidase A [Rugosibacter aromaticivorans]